MLKIRDNRKLNFKPTVELNAHWVWNKIILYAPMPASRKKFRAPTHTKKFSEWTRQSNDNIKTVNNETTMMWKKGNRMSLKHLVDIVAQKNLFALFACKWVCLYFFFYIDWVVTNALNRKSIFIFSIGFIRFNGFWRNKIYLFHWYRQLLVLMQMKNMLSKWWEKNKTIDEIMVTANS